MEPGYRLGRASSRYGSTTTTAFTGPVRKWKKQWVHVSPPHPTTIETNNTNAATLPLRLCRWTPLTRPDDPEEPPRRKLRYTPVADLEERKCEGVNKVDVNSKSRKIQQLTVQTISQTDDPKEAPIEKNQAAYSDMKQSSVGPISLEFDLNGRDENSEYEAVVKLPEIV